MLSVQHRASCLALGGRHSNHQSFVFASPESVRALHRNNAKYGANQSEARLYTETNGVVPQGLFFSTQPTIEVLNFDHLIS